MFADTPNTGYSVPLLDKTARSGTLLKEEGSATFQETNGIIDGEVSGGGLGEQPSSPSTSNPFWYKRKDYRSQRQSLNVHTPEEVVPGLSTISVSECTAQPPESTTSRTVESHPRRSNRLRTFFPQSLHHSLGRLPAFVHLNDIPSYGEKTIGQWGSFIYIVNQIFGAGILALPFVIQVSGWLPSLFANLLVCIVAMFGALMILRCMTMIPGNQNFERRVEYIRTVEYFLGKRFRFWTELCFYLSIQSLNVVSIAVVAQSVDHLLLRIFGMTIGVVLNPFQSWIPNFKRFFNQEQVDHIYSGGSGLILGITIGYLINAVICILLSTQTMDENMRIQYISFIFLITSVLQISGAAAVRIWHSTPPGAFLHFILTAIPFNPYQSKPSNPSDIVLLPPLLNLNITVPSLPISNFTTTFAVSALLTSATSFLSNTPFSSFLSPTQTLLDYSYHSLPSAIYSSSSSFPYFSPVSGDDFPRMFFRGNRSLDSYEDRQQFIARVTGVSQQSQTFLSDNNFESHLLPGSSSGMRIPSVINGKDSQHNINRIDKSRPCVQADVGKLEINTTDLPPSAYQRKLQASEDSLPLPPQNNEFISAKDPSPINSPPNRYNPVIVRLPGILGRYQYGQLLSTFIASYSYVNVIPSWANEITPGVKVNKAIWMSSAFSCVLYYLFGFLLAYAYPSVHTDNILQELLADTATGSITKFFIYIFNLLTVLPGILVYSITTRYNLVNSNQTSPRNGFIIGCIVPFTVAWLLANEEYFSVVLQWSSLLFSLAVNFIVPSVVYTAACGTQRLATRNPTRHFQSMLNYASRAKQGVNHMINDVSLHFREYLMSLPSAELDPDLCALLYQLSPTVSRPPSAEHSPHPYLISTPTKIPASPILLNTDPGVLWPPDVIVSNTSLPRATSPDRFHFGTGGIFQERNETTITPEMPVSIWTTQQTPSMISDHQTMSQHLIFGPSDLLSTPSLDFEYHLLKSNSIMGRRCTSPDVLARQRGTSVFHLDPEIIELASGGSPFLSRPRSFSLLIPSKFSFEETSTTEEVEIPQRMSTPVSLETAICNTVQLPIPLLLNTVPPFSKQSIDTLQLPLPLAPIDDSSLESLTVDQCVIDQDAAVSSPPLAVSVTEPATPNFDQFLFDTPGLSLSTYQQYTQSSLSDSALSPSTSSMERPLASHPTVPSVLEDSAIPVSRLLSRTKASTFSDGGGVNLPKEKSPRYRRSATFQFPSIVTTPKKSKQVNFGSHDEDVTFEKLSFRIMKVMSESKMPKEAPKRRLWKDVVEEFLRSSFSLSKSRDSTSFDEDSKPSSGFLKKFGTLDWSPYETSQSATNRYSTACGQPVGFGTSPFSDSHDDVTPSSLQRCYSFGPSYHESPIPYQGWKHGLERGRTLLVAGSKDFPAITVSPTPEPTPKLAPYDVPINQLLRSVSKEIHPASFATPSLLSRASTCDATVCFSGTRPIRGASSTLHGVTPLNGVRNNTVKFGESRESRISNLWNSWDGLIFHSSSPVNDNLTLLDSPTKTIPEDVELEDLMLYDEQKVDSNIVKTELRLPVSLIKDIEKSVTQPTVSNEQQNNDLKDRIPILSLPSVLRRSDRFDSPSRSKPLVLDGTSYASEDYSPLWTFKQTDQSNRSKTPRSVNDSRSSSRDRTSPRRPTTARTLGKSGRTFLAPPPVFNELPLEPPVELSKNSLPR